MFHFLRLAVRMMLSVIIVLPCASVTAATKCQAEPGNLYEQVFCQLSSSRYNYGLPSLQEFRRNPAKVQYLLLKRAASREGIALSKPPKASSTSKSTSTAAIARSTGPTQPKPASNPEPADVKQRDCRYQTRQIECGERRYRLRTNLSNSALPKDALSDNNVLRLPLKSANEPVEVWLAHAYKQYIDALMSIGLAGSSSSYSAFAHTYYELENSNTDFATRIENSFALLKKDKRSLVAGKRYPASAPLAADCEWLASTLLVCNSAGKNWVYASD